MRLAVSVSLLAILAAVQLTTAKAQDGASEENAEVAATDDNRTILVSASRSGTKLSDLPISTSVVSEEELAEQLDVSTNIMRRWNSPSPAAPPVPGSCRSLGSQPQKSSASRARSWRGLT